MPDHWYRQIEKWMDIFLDDEPDLMALELVREFNKLKKKLYDICDEDMNEWTESSEIYVGIRSEVVREKVDIVLDSSYPVARPKENSKERLKLYQVPISSLSPESKK